MCDDKLAAILIIISSVIHLNFHILIEDFMRLPTYPQVKEEEKSFFS